MTNVLILGNNPLVVGAIKKSTKLKLVGAIKNADIIIVVLHPMTKVSEVVRLLGAELKATIVGLQGFGSHSAAASLIDQFGAKVTAVVHEPNREADVANFVDCLETDTLEKLNIAVL